METPLVRDHLMRRSKIVRCIIARFAGWARVRWATASVTRGRARPGSWRSVSEQPPKVCGCWSREWCVCADVLSNPLLKKVSARRSATERSVGCRFRDAFAVLDVRRSVCRKVTHLQRVEEADTGRPSPFATHFRLLRERFKNPRAGVFKSVSATEFQMRVMRWLALLLIWWSREMGVLLGRRI